MICIDNANAYFKSHPMGAAWKEYQTGQKESAIEYSKRELSRALGRAMKEDEPQYRYGDRTRDEYAVYEQALYVLLRDCQPNSTGVVMPSSEPDEAQPTAHTMANGKDHFAAEALRWLGGSVRVETVLG